MNRRTDRELDADLAALLRTPLDPVLADPNRLRIMAALVGLPADGAMRFTHLRHALGLTDGNLGTHLAVLEDAGFVSVDETWSGKRRTRWFAPTGSGREAFAAHVRNLRAVVAAAGED